MDDTQNQIDKLRRYVAAAEESLAAAKQALTEIDHTSPAATNDKLNFAENSRVSEGGKVVEGTFDGENMVGPEEKIYPVPANYASKSKLVQGDRLKLTVADDGSFIFKQIGPIERKKIVGTLNFEDNAYHVLADGKSYNVLHASVTYYKAKPGEKVTIVVPRDLETNWATLENIIHDVKETEATEETGLLEEDDPKKVELEPLTSPEDEVIPEEAPAAEPAVFEPAESAETTPAPESVTAEPVTENPVEIFNTPAAPEIKSETTEAPTIEEPIASAPSELGAPTEGSVMPEESFLPRGQDDETNSLGEKTASAWDTAATPANPISELDI